MGVGVLKMALNMPKINTEPQKMAQNIPKACPHHIKLQETSVIKLNLH